MFKVVLTLATIASIATACDDPPTGGNEGPRPSITLQQTEASVIPSDAIGPTYRIAIAIPFTVERNGVSGPLSVTTAGSILTAFVPATVPDGATASGSLFTQVNQTLAVGAHEVPIIVSNGEVSDTAIFTVRVPAFRMWLVARRVALSQGATQKISVGIKSATSQPRIVTIGGLPAGVTHTVSSSLTNPTVELSAATNAELGAFHVTVKVEAGTFAESRLFELTVQPARPTRPIAFRLCWSRTPPPGQLRGLIGPSSVYYANDGAAWTAVTPDAEDFIRFDATEKVAIAFTAFGMHEYGPGPYLRVIHTTATELEQMQCPRASGTKSFRLKVENSNGYSVALGAFRVLAAPPATPSITGFAAAGSLDLIAAGLRTVPAGVQRVVVLRRGVDLAHLDTIRVDFAGAERVALDSALHTLSTAWSVVTYLHTATTIGSLSGAASSPNFYFAVPASQLAPADIQSVILSALSSRTTRGIIQYFRTPSPLDPTPGPAVASPTADSLAGTVTLPSQAEYPDVAGVGQRYVLDGRGIYHDIEVWMTKGYAGSSSAWTFPAADCAGLASCTPRPWSALGAISAAAASTHGASPAVFFGVTPPPGTRVTWSVTNYGLMAAGLPFPMDR